MERLDKILANTGRWSRKEARELVRAGRVAVDGVTAQAADGKYDPAARFEVDGETVSGERLVYLMLHKPAGLLSATEDPRQPTVLDLLPEHLRRVGLFPVGRLDKDTEGLLLLTNDGPLGHRLLTPARHVDKVYFVRAAGRLDEEDAAAFRAGMMLGDGLRCLPAELELPPPQAARDSVMAAAMTKARSFFMNVFSSLKDHVQEPDGSRTNILKPGEPVLIEGRFNSGDGGLSPRTPRRSPHSWT